MGEEEKKSLIDSALELPLLKKLPSTAFGVGALPLACYFTGWVPVEQLVHPFGTVCWALAAVIMLNDLIGAIQRHLAK